MENTSVRLVQTYSSPKKPYSPTSASTNTTPSRKAFDAESDLSTETYESFIDELLDMEEWKGED
jgi:hypothetical protein